VVEKAIASEGGGELATRRAMAFGRALSAHYNKLRAEPGAYGRIGLAELFEMREECLREFGFNDVYRWGKEQKGRRGPCVDPFASSRASSASTAPSLTLIPLGFSASCRDRVKPFIRIP
jgi:hypothetical protein